MVIDYELCVDILSRIFEKAGADSQNARRQATLFVTTEAKGVYSHGVCLTPKYVQRFLDGAINLTPNIKIHSNAPAVASVDGDQGLGVVVLEYAIDRAMQMAQKNGIGIVTATNLQHYAAGLSYIDRVTDQGMMISIGEFTKIHGPLWRQPKILWNESADICGSNGRIAAVLSGYGKLSVCGK